MKRIFLSLPMSGRTDEEIRKEALKMVDLVNATEAFGDNIIFDWNGMCSPDETEKFTLAINGRFQNLWYLGEAIKKMAYCDAVLFSEDYHDARGCNVELYICGRYGIPAYQIEDGEIKTIVKWSDDVKTSLDKYIDDHPWKEEKQ